MSRRTYQGSKNNKERSIERLINAVGDVIKEKGYTGLSAASIARAAQLDRKLITLYFESTEKLIEAYIRKKDYWISSTNSAKDEISKLKDASLKEVVITLLQKQFDFFYQNEEMQKIVLWEVSEFNNLMYRHSEEREKLGTELFQKLDLELNVDTDIRATTALLVAGIYYVILHSVANNTTFCELDIRSEEGQIRIKRAIRSIIENLFSHQ